MEEIVMSETHVTEAKWERWWPAGVIAFGVLFVALLVSFHPFW